MKRIFLFVLALMLTACSAGTASDFDKNLAKWNDAKVSHYRYSLFIGCFCAFRNDLPLTIEVKDGEVVSMTDSNGTLITPAEEFYDTYEPYSTIDRIFLKLQADFTADADDIIVTYDPNYGYPANVAIDYIRDAVDDELSYQVSDFEVLE